MQKHVLTLLLVCINVFVFAQQDTLHKNHRFYYGIGLSGGKGTEDGGYGELHIYLQRKTNYIAFKSSGISKFELFGDEPNPSISDVGIIVGKSYSFDRYFNLKFGAGLAFTEQISRGAFLYNTCKSMFCLLDHDVYETIATRTIGVPLEVKTSFLVGRAAALTIGISANLNGAKNFCGFSVGVTLGRLRDRAR
ncbi:hypothetical protein H9N25_00890 [Pedobacter riviphilus]|uniref:Outer membrane protein beta-barrel domain-containing protein n=1 Tax=Pedobacter riviphilus TaxID=2766984 RepID=A0ABX6THZ3_9SPHI|nr:MULTISPECIES: hypothetical protein [Pedobacter]NMN35107.1 hypothetical protein [Pedobacter sp. SG918]QNR85096.1 hypothetical protein H9N25_00890 [Pedobacter riviphilus]